VKAWNSLLETSDLINSFQNPDDFVLVKIWMQQSMPKSSGNIKKHWLILKPVSGNDLAGCLDMDLRPAQVIYL